MSKHSLQICDNWKGLWIESLWAFFGKICVEIYCFEGLLNLIFCLDLCIDETIELDKSQEENI